MNRSMTLLSMLNNEVSFAAVPRSMDQIPVYTYKHNMSTYLFADRVHVSNHWILVQALAHTPVPNYDMPYRI